MKRLYITLSLVLAMQLASAQSKETEAADKLYARMEYVDAADAYLKLAGKNDPYVFRQLAESYYNVFNSKEAVKWYAKATQTTF